MSEPDVLAQVDEIFHDIEDDPTALGDWTTSDMWDDLVLPLADEVRRLRDRPCPHVHTSDEGTSHCALAETEVRRLAARVETLEGAIEDQALLVDTGPGSTGTYSGHDVARLLRALVAPDTPTSPTDRGGV